MAVIAGVAVTVADVAAVGGVDGGIWVTIAAVSERLGARLTTPCPLLPVLAQSPYQVMLWHVTVYLEYFNNLS
jgi:hypothetical protein